MTEEKRPLDMTRIVLAVDDELDAFFIQSELRRLDFPFTLRRVVSKTKLVEVLVSSDPDLLVLDFEMINLEILSGLREQWPNLPVIVVSPSKDLELPERVKRAGAADFVHMSELSLLSDSIETHVPRENSLATRA
jgi:DNA-binding NarL/FixJ family response regulator